MKKRCNDHTKNPNMKKRQNLNIQLMVPLILLIALVSSCENETVERPVYANAPIDTISTCNASFSMYTVGESAIQGMGEIVSKEHTVSGFHEIELKKIGIAEISLGTEYKVEVSDYENLVDLVNITVDNDRLIIGYRDTSVKNSRLNIKVTMPALSTVVLSGTGCIDILSEFDNLNELSLTGNGNIILHSAFSSDDLYVNLEGDGQILAAGNAASLTVDLTGSGAVNLSEMTSQNADCLVGGSGTINVHVVSSLKALITGTGNIVYYGNPTVEKNITGTGAVTKGK
jgi:hypothetical protein